MSISMNPYLSLPGKAREAMEFYHAVLGGDLAISTFADHDLTDGVDAEAVMHAKLVSDAGLVVMATDNSPHADGSDTPGASIYVTGTDEDAMRGYFDGFSKGGTVMVPIQEQKWGAQFGMVTDRFGVNWMINIKKD